MAKEIKNAESARPVYTFGDASPNVIRPAHRPRQMASANPSKKHSILVLSVVAIVLGGGLLGAGFYFFIDSKKCSFEAALDVVDQKVDIGSRRESLKNIITQKHGILARYHAHAYPDKKTAVALLEFLKKSNCKESLHEARSSSGSAVVGSIEKIQECNKIIELLAEPTCLSHERRFYEKSFLINAKDRSKIQGCPHYDPVNDKCPLRASQNFIDIGNELMLQISAVPKKSEKQFSSIKSADSVSYRSLEDSRVTKVENGNACLTISAGNEKCRVGSYCVHLSDYPFLIANAENECTCKRGFVVKNGACVPQCEKNFCFDHEAGECKNISGKRLKYLPVRSHCECADGYSLKASGECELDCSFESNCQLNGECITRSLEFFVNAGDKKCRCAENSCILGNKCVHITDKAKESGMYVSDIGVCSCLLNHVPQAHGCEVDCSSENVCRIGNSCILIDNAKFEITGKRSKEPEHIGTCVCLKDEECTLGNKCVKFDAENMTLSVDKSGKCQCKIGSIMNDKNECVPTCQEDIKSNCLLQNEKCVRIAAQDTGHPLERNDSTIFCKCQKKYKCLLDNKCVKIGPNFHTSSNNAFCNCNPGFTFNGKGECVADCDNSANCILNGNCVPLPPNFRKDEGTKKCTCNENFCQLGIECKRKESLVNHSKLENDAKNFCICKRGYFLTNYGCAIDCDHPENCRYGDTCHELIEYAHFKRSEDTKTKGLCLCKKNDECIDEKLCITRPNKIKTDLSSSNGKCTCHDGYVFNSIKKTCEPNCSTITEKSCNLENGSCVGLISSKYSVDLETDTSSGACKCKEDSSCLFGERCIASKDISNSNSLAPFCACMPGYILNSDPKCELDCTVENNCYLNGECVPKPLNFDKNGLTNTCVCKSGYCQLGNECKENSNLLNSEALVNHKDHFCACNKAHKLSATGCIRNCSDPQFCYLNGQCQKLSDFKFFEKPDKSKNSDACICKIVDTCMHKGVCISMKKNSIMKAEKSGNGFCICEKGYEMDSSGKCAPSCSEISINSCKLQGAECIGLINNVNYNELQSETTSGNCKCQNKFKCLMGRECIDPGINFKDNPQGSRCICKTGYVFNDELKCVLDCEIDSNCNLNGFCVPIPTDFIKIVTSKKCACKKNWCQIDNICKKKSTLKNYSVAQINKDGMCVCQDGYQLTNLGCAANCDHQNFCNLRDQCIFIRDDLNLKRSTTANTIGLCECKVENFCILGTICQKFGLHMETELSISKGICKCQQGYRMNNENNCVPNCDETNEKSCKLEDRSCVSLKDKEYSSILETDLSSGDCKCKREYDCLLGKKCIFAGINFKKISNHFFCQCEIGFSLKSKAECSSVPM